MDANKYSIRPAERNDCKELYHLIKELAVDMRAPDDATKKLTPEVLERDGFDSNPPCFKCFVVDDATSCSTAKLIGYVLYYTTYHGWRGKTMHLENLYVRPSYHGTGLGTALMKKVCEEAHNENCDDIDFYVFTWNTATEFYVKLGANNLTEIKDLHIWRMGKESIAALVNNKD